VLRLVMAAGGNRDFNSIHHNTNAARATLAPDMYANTLFLQGMWERAARQYIGNAGTIIKFADLKMVSFNPAGDTAVVRGRVLDRRDHADHAEVELQMWTENSVGVSVGPGTVTVTIPA
jgi:acyl dehydratase